VSMENKAVICTRQLALSAALLGLIVGVLLCPQLAIGAPNTPWGIAPPVFPGTTHPDSTLAWMARADLLEHRPLAITAAINGLTAARHGDYKSASAYWEQSTSLDPTYCAPSVMPLRFGLLRNPKEALKAIIRLPEALESSFANQIDLTANLLIFTIFPLLIASCATAMLLFIKHAPRLYHLFFENLNLLMPSNLAKWVVWALFLLPLVWQLGWLIWVSILLAAALPLLASGERRFAYGMLALLLIAPLGVETIAKVVGPADPGHPASLQWRAQSGGANENLLEEVRRSQSVYPKDGNLYFSESLLARQAGDLRAAEIALDKASIFPTLSEERFASARGILAYKKGDIAEAIRQFVKATDDNGGSFNVHYNLAKAYARKSLFLKADREMKSAFRIDDARVRREEIRRLELQARDLIEERLSSFDIWKVWLNYPLTSSFQMPIVMAGLFPGQNPRNIWVCLLLIPAVLYFTHLWHRRIQTHLCCNCGRVVCRRCLKRRERRIYCSDCSLTAGKWASAQYTQILLTRVLGRHDRARDMLVDTARFIVPGFGEIKRGRVGRAFWQLFLVSMAGIWLAADGLPIKGIYWTHLEELLLPPIPIGILILLIVAVSNVKSEISGLRKQTQLKQFLLSAHFPGQKRDAA